MFKNTFNKKSLFSLLLAFAMLFSFVGSTGTVFADGPGTGNEWGIATTQFDLKMTSANVTLSSQTVDSTTTTLSNRDYSIKRRNTNRDYYTGNGFDLKDFIENNLPTGKTMSNIENIIVTCNDLKEEDGILVPLKGEFTPAQLFGTTVAPLKYFDTPEATGVAVPTSINFGVALRGTTTFDTDSAVRLLVGQADAEDVNMPNCLKWVSSIEVVLN